MLTENPKLRREIVSLTATQARIAAELAATDLAQYGEKPDAVWALLAAGGFTADQGLKDWFPDTTAQ